MSVAVSQGMTVAEFLAWEDGQEERWEFDGLAPVAMVGGTRAHAILAVNLVTRLQGQLRGGPCQAFVEGMKIEAAESVRYPDVFVSCGGGAPSALLEENPVVVFEIESPSTAHIDFGAKNAEYRATPSITRYVILAQDRVAATMFERRGGEWVGSLVTDPAATIDMPEIGAAVNLGELYENVLG